MSLSIEILQLFTFRATDVDDLMMNTIGALVGYGIAKLILRKNGKAEDKDRDGIKLVAMIVIFQFEHIGLDQQDGKEKWGVALILSTMVQSFSKKGLKYKFYIVKYRYRSLDEKIIGGLIHYGIF